MTVPARPIVHKIHFKPSSLSYKEVFQLVNDYYIIHTWHRSNLVYAIVLELTANGKVNTTY